MTVNDYGNDFQLFQAMVLRVFIQYLQLDISM